MGACTVQGSYAGSDGEEALRKLEEKLAAAEEDMIISPEESDEVAAS